MNMKRWIHLKSSIITHTPSGASRVAVTSVARTLSTETDWISVATLPMLTMLTCAERGEETLVTHLFHKNNTEE